MLLWVIFFITSIKSSEPGRPDTGPISASYLCAPWVCHFTFAFIWKSFYSIGQLSQFTLIIKLIFGLDSFPIVLWYIFPPAHYLIFRKAYIFVLIVFWRNTFLSLIHFFFLLLYIDSLQEIVTLDINLFLSLIFYPVTWNVFFLLLDKCF